MRPYAPDSSFARSASTHSWGDRYLHRWGKRNGTKRRIRFRDHAGAARQAARRALRSEVEAARAEAAEGAVLVGAHSPLLIAEHMAYVMQTTLDLMDEPPVGLFEDPDFAFDDTDWY